MFPSIESSPDYLARYFRFGTALLHERGLRDILTNILYITRRCYYRQNEANNRISCALLRENHSSPDRFSILPPTLAFDLTDLAILTPVDPSCHVCLRTNCVQCVCVCVQISCVSRDSMPCCIVFGIDMRGKGEGEERGR